MPVKMSTTINGDKYIGQFPDLTISSELRPFVCPVCWGRGTVPKGFYNHLEASTTDTSYEMCRSCQGTGVIWR